MRVAIAGRADVEAREAFTELIGWIYLFSGTGWLLVRFKMETHRLLLHPSHWWHQKEAERVHSCDDPDGVPAHLLVHPSQSDIDLLTDGMRD